jgi:hypothetical protein
VNTTTKIQHRKVVRCETEDSCAREKCENCGEVLSYEHDWVEDEHRRETDYNINPVSGSHVDSDTTTYFYHCTRCPETKSESSTSEWIVH